MYLDSLTEFKMITVETYTRFGSRFPIEIRFFDGDKRIGKVYCKSFNEVSTLIGHYEKVFGCPVKFPEM